MARSTVILIIKFQNNTFPCKLHTCKWPVVKDNDVEIKPIIYVVFVLEGQKCKFIKTKLCWLNRYVLLCHLALMDRTEMLFSVAAKRGMQ